MKHAGSQDALLARLGLDAAAPSQRRRLAAALRRQSGLSRLVSFACALLLVAVVADAPVRDLARSLDPSVVAVLRVVTQFGNSAWPLGLCLMIYAAVVIVARKPNPFPPEALQNLRSVLILVAGSVAISGTIASLTKNMIGRARPSTGVDPNVFEFVFLSFRPGWAAFPSGHSTTATACAVALAIAFPRQAMAWLSIGLTTALSRAFLGVHWLTDCLAGIAVGVLVTLALRKWMERRHHTFDTDPALVLRVAVLATASGLSSASVYAMGSGRRARAVFRRLAGQLRQGRAP